MRREEALIMEESDVAAQVGDYNLVGDEKLVGDGEPVGDVWIIWRMNLRRKWAMTRQVGDG